jgi:hypothetical protein
MANDFGVTFLPSVQGADPGSQTALQPGDDVFKTISLLLPHILGAQAPAAARLFAPNNTGGSTPLTLESLRRWFQQQGFNAPAAETSQPPSNLSSELRNYGQMAGSSSYSPRLTFGSDPTTPTKADTTSDALPSMNRSS